MGRARPYVTVGPPNPRESPSHGESRIVWLLQPDETPVIEPDRPGVNVLVGLLIPEPLNPRCPLPN